MPVVAHLAHGNAATVALGEQDVGIGAQVERPENFRLAGIQRQIVASRTLRRGAGTVQRIVGALVDLTGWAGRSPVHVQRGARGVQDGRIAVWQWSFGDGTNSSQQSPVHTYSSPGHFRVSLNVTDDLGATDTKERDTDVKK
jgi:PKD domain